MNDSDKVTSGCPAGKTALIALNYRFIFVDASKSRSRTLLCALFGLWLLGVSILMAFHVVWRDEVRALSYALQGRDVVAMLKALHGEGHPALWYLLLRAAHTVFPLPQVLPAVAFVIAASAIWLLVFRSPFSLPVIAILLASYFAGYEYSVMARNYGISMLLLFLFAALYNKWRNRGWVLGPLLFLLANTNTYSVILVAALLLFWCLDVLTFKPFVWSKQLNVFLLNALPAVLGILVCWFTVHPLINDAAIYDHPEGLSPTLIAKQLISPSGAFDALLGRPFDYLTLERIGPTASHVLSVLFSLFLFGVTLGLLPRPPAFVAAVAALVVLSVFFGTVAPGLYRHQALWLVFLVSLYWIHGSSITQRTRETAKVEPYGRNLATLGSVLFVILLIAQIPHYVAKLAHPGNESRSADLAQLIARSSLLSSAIIIADPDYLVESLPYFLPNSTYLLREDRFGHIPVFTKKAQLDLSLEQVLTKARQLRVENKLPVVILLQQRLNLSQPDTTYREGYDWQFIVTNAMIAEFLSGVQLLASFPNAAPGGDESFDVYVMK